MSRIPARLSRLEAGAPGCSDLPALPELATLGALMDAPDATAAEQRILMNARLETLLARVWPKAMTGDVAAAGLAVRLLDRQADLLGLTTAAQDPEGPITAEDLMRMIEGRHEMEADTGR
ncbi:hypothetical protein AB0O22_12805 [Streptomyces sp. NPDC091204]|uniref:hypothetical protein n=1 Tax=Streptomyces sp. NPDC091204 TaxID=3155299 RepID=UPI0034394D4F